MNAAPVPFHLPTTDTKKATFLQKFAFFRQNFQFCTGMFIIINIPKEAEGFYILDIGTVFHQGIWLKKSDL